MVTASLRFRYTQQPSDTPTGTSLNEVHRTYKLCVRTHAGPVYTTNEAV